MIVLPRIVAYIVFTVLGVAFQLPSGVPAAGGRLGIDGENFQDMAAQLNDTQQQILAVQGLKEEAMKEALAQGAALQQAAPVSGASEIDPRLLQEMMQRESGAPLPGTGDRRGLQTELWGN